MHGDPGIYLREGEWSDDQTIVIHPDQTPLGVETVPPPGQSIMTAPDGRVFQGPMLMPTPQYQGPAQAPPPPQQGSPLPPPPPQPGPAVPPQQPPPPPNGVPPQQGPMLEPMPAVPDQARYGPPPWQPPPQNVQAAYYQPNAAAPRR
jgi:hypothetical protein